MEKGPYLCYTSCHLTIPSTNSPEIILASNDAPTSTVQLGPSIDTGKIVTSGHPFPQQVLVLRNYPEY